MTREPIWNDDSAKMLLHIIPQPTYHFPAKICGSPDALRRLGEALLQVANEGVSADCGDFMPNDGEGYSVNIIPLSQWEMEDVPLPYAQLGQFWDFECNCGRAARPTAPATGEGERG